MSRPMPTSVKITPAAVTNHVIYIHIARSTTHRPHSHFTADFSPTTPHGGKCTRLPRCCEGTMPHHVHSRRVHHSLPRGVTNWTVGTNIHKTGSTLHIAYHQRRPEPWPRVTRTENFVTFRHVVFETCEQRDKQIYRHEITILCTPHGGEVKYMHSFF